jgi:hypothetical protein
MSPFEKPQGPPFEKPPASAKATAGRQGPKPQDGSNYKPPVFRRWSGWYWLVFLVMVLQVLLYLFITRSFS